MTTPAPNRGYYEAEDAEILRLREIGANAHQRRTLAHYSEMAADSARSRAEPAVTPAIEQASRQFMTVADSLPRIMDLADAEVALLSDLTLVYGQEVDPDDAEAVEQHLEAMSRLAAEFVGNEALVVRKVERYIHVLETQDMMVASFKARAKRMRDRATAIENGQNELKQRLIDAMHVMDRESVITPSGVASIAKNPVSCVVVDEAQVPREFVKTVITTSVDKNAIKAHVKATGEIVPGTELVRGESLRIS